MRPPTSDQNKTISTTAPATDLTTVDTFFDTAAADDESIVDLTDPATRPTADSSTASSTVAAAALTVTAPWRNGAPIDPRYSCKGVNVSPALSWSPAPAGTKAIAVTMVDLDFTSFNHWTLTSVPVDATTLAEGAAPGAGGYSGPCPPAGTTHTYEITVHYLGTALAVTTDTGVARRPAIDAATIASAKVTGVFTGS
jgi:phosphatidylethanolamine-binding protein (PEBP) family uncharacterized protein